MAPPPLDTLIVGQGLAGTALAWHLMDRGQRVCIIDDGHRSSSSLVAAGLINPLAGMRFNRPPRTLDWLDYATAWYGRLSEELGATLFYPRPMLRLFRSPQQRRFYQRRAEDRDSASLLGDAFEADACPEDVIAANGGFTQHRTGHVDLPLLLRLAAAKLSGNAALRHGKAEAERIEPTTDGISLDGINARSLIFCDGARLRDNPWFAYLPLRPVKGQIIDVTVGDWHSNHIINGAHWLVPSPHEPSLFRFGATHEHNFDTEGPDPQARERLLQGLAALGLARPGMTLHDEQAGVRPATADRQPLIGFHPRARQLAVFNGFGARGALTIPWFARRLADHIVDGRSLPAEADIARFPCPRA